MTRKLKALGLALVVVFVLSALAAAAAQAETETAEFSWDSGTTRLTGEEDPATPIQIFTVNTKGTGIVKVECDEPHFEIAGAAGAGAKTLTAENIDYSDTATTGAGKPGPNICTGTFKAEVPVKMNGCGYVFHAGTTLVSPPSDGESEGTLDIVCPAGKEIVLEAPGCTIRVKAQTGLGPVYYETETTTPESVTIEALVGLKEAAHNKSITYSTEGPICGLQKDRAGGTYTGNITVTGFNKDNARTNVTVT